METQNKTNTTTQQELNWVDQELKELQKQTDIQNKKPALKLEENKLCEFDVLTENKWEKWVDQETGTTKKIIPINHDGVEKVLFMNVQNPTYKKMLEQVSKGKKHFKIVRVGTQKQTRFNIIE